MSNGVGNVEYFATFGPTTDVGQHIASVASLPRYPVALGEIVRGVLIHNWTAEMTGIASSPNRDGMKTFGAGPTLDRILTLDSAPLERPRLPEHRLIGYCYHFALLHCALLRAQGVPARARCGFANYLTEGKWTDHWVTELWDGDHWRLNDSQIGLDQLSHDDFRDGVRAWKLCRQGESHPYDYGIGDLWGWDELRGSLVNDLGALNKIEIGDWDWCDLLRVDPLDQPDLVADTHLDRLVSFIEPDKPLSGLHVAFGHDDAVRPPDEIVRLASPR